MFVSLRQAAANNHLPYAGLLPNKTRQASLISLSGPRNSGRPSADMHNGMGCSMHVTPQA
jgi:hypothetical protein